MTLNEFVAKWDGKFADYDNFYGFQCWDLAAFYVRDVVGCPSLPTGPSQGAKDCFLVFSQPLPKYFDKIPNVVSDPNCIPQAGDVVVWGPMSGNAYGHIGICTSANSNGFVSFDQNWPINSSAHNQNHNYNYVIGWLRPKGGDMTTTDNVYWMYRDILGRGNGSTGDPAAAAYVGKPYAQVYSDLYNSQEAIAYRTGLVNKDTQIAGLTSQVTILTDQSVRQKNQITACEAAIVLVQTDLVDRTEEFETLKDINSEQAKQILDLQKQLASQPTTGTPDYTLSGLLNYFREFIKKWLS